MPLAQNQKQSRFINKGCLVSFCYSFSTHALQGSQGKKEAKIQDINYPPVLSLASLASLAQPSQTFDSLCATATTFYLKGKLKSVLNFIQIRIQNKLQKRQELGDTGVVFPDPYEPTGLITSCNNYNPPRTGGGPERVCQYKNTNKNKIKNNSKNQNKKFNSYLAGLFEGDGHIWLPNIN